nr:platelet endothelial aggregation receptor 1-like [Lytechinus pictus]
MLCSFFHILQLFFGFVGQNCQYADCTQSGCYHGGACNTQLLGDPTCLCAVGYTGVMCETEIDECESNPCQNGATCENYVAIYRCVCPANFTGQQCESRITGATEAPRTGGFQMETWLIVIIVLAVVILIVISVLITGLFCMRRSKTPKLSDRENWEMKNGALITPMVARARTQQNGHARTHDDSRSPPPTYGSLPASQRARAVAEGATPIPRQGESSSRPGSRAIHYQHRSYIENGNVRNGQLLTSTPQAPKPGGSGTRHSRSYSLEGAQNSGYFVDDADYSPTRIEQSTGDGDDYSISSAELEQFMVSMAMNNTSQ